MGFSDIADRRAARASTRRRCAALRARQGIEPGVQARGHLRRRVRGLHPVLLLHLRRRRTRRGPSTRKKIMILGGGPNRIGQGIEFDYCCVHAAFALREIGYETIMVNSNPETVSTDYDTSDKLYFEPLTREDVLAIVDREKPDGRHRPARRPDAAQPRRGAGEGGRAHHRDEPRLHRPGGGPEAVLASWSDTLGLRQPENGTAVDVAEALPAAHGIGYPVLVRPSYVLGGRAMEIVYDDASLRALHAAGGLGVTGEARPHRQVHRGRHRGGRGHGLRRAHVRHRRDHGAHRGGGRALGGRRHGAARRTPFRTGCSRRSAATPCALPRSCTWSAS